jgi:hypothetical protein
MLLSRIAHIYGNELRVPPNNRTICLWLMSFMAIFGTLIPKADADGPSGAYQLSVGID